MRVKLRKYNHFSPNPAVLAATLQGVPEAMPESCGA
jgi:hypothetical protein